jgi:uncharacterized repeat protein (TIGR01451 family)/fimbrial isopeptide formation D2 family protein
MTKITVEDNDKVTINVICPEPENPGVSVEKFVKWDCTGPYVETVDAEIGDYVTFQIIVNNTGGTALNITVIDQLPDGLEYNDSADPPPDVISGNTIAWNLSNVQPGTSITITFEADVTACGQLINLAQVTGHAPDIEPVNDQDTATVNVECPEPENPGVSVEKFVKWDCTGPYVETVDAEIGDYVTFQIIVNNTGETELDIVLTDQLPDGLEYNDSASTPPDDASGNTITWTLSNIPPGTSITITFEADVTACGQLINLAQVTGIACGYEPINDQDTATVNVECVIWDKSSIEVTGICISPDAVFTITNTAEPGEGDMDGLSEYRIYRNEILERTKYFQLKGGESLIVKVPADCDIIRLEADQRPGHPGYGKPQTTIEDCGCDYPLLEVDIKTGLEIGKLNAEIKNNKKKDLSDIAWGISVKSTGLFRIIDSTTKNVIKLLEPSAEKKLQTGLIFGFGGVKIEFKATAPDVGMVSTTANGLVIGRMIIVF